MLKHGYDFSGFSHYPKKVTVNIFSLKIYFAGKIVRKNLTCRTLLMPFTLNISLNKTMELLIELFRCGC